MKEWLKCFGLGFFLHKQSKEAASRSFLNFLLGFILSLVFIFCGVLAANTLPFASNLKKSEKYLEFVENAFSTLEITVSGGKVNCAKTVDTLLEENSPYKINGYDLVIDTRGVDAYDDFIALYVASENEKITPEQYSFLSDEEKKKYKLEITYTPNELILTDEMTEQFETYLEASSAADDLKNLKEKYGNNESAYKENVYALYLRTFYKDFVTAAGSPLPRLRSYYYLNYVNNAKTDKYLFVFDDLLVGGCETDGGLETTFYGLTKDIKDCAVNADNAGDFLISAVKGATGMMASEYTVTVVRNMPLILLVPAALALLMMLVLKAIGADEKQRKYLPCLRVQGVFLAYAALISAFVNFVLGYFVPASVLNRLPVLFFSAVMLIRNIAYIIAEKISIDKTSPTVEEIIKEDENTNG